MSAVKEDLVFTEVPVTQNTENDLLKEDLLWSILTSAYEELVAKAAELDQDWLFDPLLYHRPRNTLVCLVTKTADGKWDQKWVYTRTLHKELAKMDLSKDCWISQAEFSDRKRDLQHVSHLQCCFLDLDWMKCPAWANGLLPDPDNGGVELVLDHCKEAGIPEPTLITRSGNGLHLKWVYKQVIPAAALPRWNVVQKFLCKAFEGFGADPASLDASRVLRLPGSMNNKPHTVDRQVRVVHHAPVSFSFDELADAVLPMTREEIRQQAQAKQEKKAAQKKQRVAGSNHMSMKEMCNKRSQDILKLIEMRRLASGDLPIGKRELAVFWKLLCEAQSGYLTTANFEARAQALIDLMGPSFQTDCKPQVFGTLRNILEKVEAGDPMKEWNGKMVPRLYRISTRRLIEILAITSDEQRKLEVIISKEEKQRRRTERRRAAGVLPRAVWLALHPQERTKAWETEGKSRRAWFYTKKKAKEALAAAEAAAKAFREALAAMVATLKQRVADIQDRKRECAANMAAGCPLAASAAPVHPMLSLVQGLASSLANLGDEVGILQSQTE